MRTLNCDICEKDFVSNGRGVVKRCSDECRKKYYQAYQKNYLPSYQNEVVRGNIIKQGQSLVLGNYKEPLNPVPGGFGYYGAVRFTTDGSKIECHICGRVFSSVAKHSLYTHKIPHKEYRKKFDLSEGTALVSETYRERLKEIAAERISKYTEEQLAAIRKQLDDIRPKHHEPVRKRLSSHNKNDTCPRQVINKLKKFRRVHGWIPSNGHKFAAIDGWRYPRLARIYFGSWKEALKIANLEPKKHYATRRKYTDEELLDALKNHFKFTKKIPTESDSLRELIPSSAIYYKRFGGIKKARDLAGVPTL